MCDDLHVGRGSDCDQPRSERLFPLLVHDLHVGRGSDCDQPSQSERLLALLVPIWAATPHTVSPAHAFHSAGT
jgi:hypothetical protein